MVRILIVGAGYVGLSTAILLSEKNKCTLFDISFDKIDMINSGIAPIPNDEIQDYLSSNKLKFHAVSHLEDIPHGFDVVIVAVSTDYSSGNDGLDTSSIETVFISLAEREKNATFVIRSTVPVGYTSNIRRTYPNNHIIVNPEFLRESHPLRDIYNPYRIILGFDENNIVAYDRVQAIATLLLQAAEPKDVPVLLMTSEEAEATKLFANTYLSLRVCYFNELDTFARKNQLNTRRVIEGICLDPRIGSLYNNPSFGYGGSCLPKDTLQLLRNFGNLPQKIIGAIPSSNNIRKAYIANEILMHKPKVVGVYRLEVKRGYEKVNVSPSLDIAYILRKQNVMIVLYEPMIRGDSFMQIPVQNNLVLFKRECDLILANRFDNNLLDVKTKVYTCDIS